MIAIYRNRASACQALLLMPVLFMLASNRQTVVAATTGIAATTGMHAKQVIGQTAMVEEIESDIAFFARVDTGATTSSLHVERWEIEDEADEMTKNLGKTIRFCIQNKEGESEWLERKIVEISVIKTSEQEEQRYKVGMTLNCLDVQKRVLVSLNDRSHMDFPVLLGRNFLQGDFVVDVDLGGRADLGSNVELRKDQTEPVASEPKPQTSQIVSRQESELEPSRPRIKNQAPSEAGPQKNRNPEEQEPNRAEPSRAGTQRKTTTETTSR